MQRVEAIVNPELLVWARKSINIPIGEIARKVHEDIELWEKGEKRPSVPQLRRLANVYKRPMAIFYLPIPPVEEALPADFRSLPSQRDYPLSKKSILAIRRAGRVQKIAKEMASELVQANRFNLIEDSASNDPETLAKKVRIRIGVSLAAQFSWADKRTALREWKRAVEDKGIIVLEMSMPIEESRAISMWDEEFPVILINTKDYFPAARIFSLFHELCHIVLKVSGISDLKESDFTEKRIEEQEIFCNHFAGAFLVPAEDLKKLAGVQSRKEWPDEIIIKLANKFNVSREVIVRRLLLTGLTGKEFYQKKREEYKKKEVEFLEKGKGGRKDPVRDCIRDNGHKFINLVYESFHEGNITYRDVADYLKISPKYLPELEQQLIKEPR